MGGESRQNLARTMPAALASRHGQKRDSSCFSIEELVAKRARIAQKTYHDFVKVCHKVSNYLADNDAHGDYVVAGSYAASLRANMLHLDNNFIFNDIDIFIPRKTLKANEYKIISIKDEYLDGVCVKVQFIEITQCSLGELVQSFDINAVRVGVKIMHNSARQPILPSESDWFVCPSFVNFLTDLHLKIIDVSKLVNPLTNLVRMLRKSAEMNLSYIAPSPTEILWYFSEKSLTLKSKRLLEVLPQAHQTQFQKLISLTSIQKETLTLDVKSDRDKSWKLYADLSNEKALCAKFKYELERSKERIDEQEKDVKRLCASLAQNTIDTKRLLGLQKASTILTHRHMLHGQSTLDPSEHEYYFVQHMFNITQGTHRINLSPNAARGKIPLLKIERIEKVCFPSILEKYIAEHNDLLGKYFPLCAPKIDKKETLFMIPDSYLNEIFAWHGTTEANLQNILKSGFDLRQPAVSGKHLGYGNYFASKASKADDYTDRPMRTRRRAARKIILCRVMLGKPFTTQRTQSGIHKAPNECDSLIAWSGDVFDNTEIVVYSNNQCIPAYVVTYAHQLGCLCAFCGQRPM